MCQRPDRRRAASRRTTMTRSRPQNGFGAKVLLSVDEAAILLGITRSTAYRAIATDTFPVPIIKVGGRWRVSREALRRILDGEAPGAYQPACKQNSQITLTRAKSDLQTREPAQSESVVCPACGFPISASIGVPSPSSRPICSAARLSSSGTESV